MKEHASFSPVKFQGEVVNKRCLASAVFSVVKKTLPNGAVGNEMMSRRPHQQKVATMAGAPLGGW